MNPNQQTHTTLWTSPWTLATAILFTAGVLLTSCGPTVRTGAAAGAGSGAAVPGGAELAPGEGETFHLAGKTGTAVYPASGLLTGVDSSLMFRFAPGTPAVTPGTGSTPYYTCVGFTVQLQRVMLDGSVTPVGSTVTVAPMQINGGSNPCNLRAQSLRPPVAVAPNTLSLPYGLTEFARLPNVAGYRLLISGAVNDYAYRDCLRSCQANPWGTDCARWALPSGGTPEERCEGYSIRPIQDTHVLAGRVAATIN